MENPKISVIIPVYNTEKYVRDAVLSIMNQTIKEIEIIIINDGSTDNSLQIIQGLATHDKRIQIFSSNNKGQSEARNAGMKKATGKYIYFMDSDDLLDDEALLDCYEKCEKEQLDFIFFDAETFGDDEQISPVFDYHREKYIENHLFKGIDILNLLLNKAVYKASVCLNLIRSSFLQDIKLSFFPGIIHEDELFTGLLYVQANRVRYVKKAYFKRRIRNNSTMTSEYSYKNINGYLNVVSQLTEFTKDEKAENVLLVIRKLIRYILDPSIYNASKLSLSERMNVLGICLRKAYLRFITPKSFIVLLFPFTIQIKEYFKKANK